MLLWESPFNKIVRSHEAGIVGLLLGIIIGVASMIFVPITVKEDQIIILPEYCDTLENTKSVSYSYTGRITKVECLDGKLYTNF